MSWGNEDGMEFDDETGELRAVVVYRLPDDGAVFSRRCSCGRMLNPAEHAMWNENGIEALGTCKKCGVVALRFICWESDGRSENNV